jgi:hypothetical protein
MLLQGMIKRDPGTRLGAWENPPQDIMSAPFFHGIQWDAIYERRFDGPYVPEVQFFSSKAKSSKSTGDAAEGNGSEQGSSGKAAEDGQKAGAEESDEGEDSESELKGMRDSVFIRPHDGGGNNLLDWSFIDEKVLAETYAEGDPADAAAAEERKARRQKKRAAAAAAEAEVKISEEIANNKVGFAAPATGEGGAPVEGAAESAPETPQADAETPASEPEATAASEAEANS